MKTIPQLMSDLAERCGSRTAIVDRQNRVSYTDIHDRSRALAAGLAQAGVGHGDRVGLWLPNIAAYLEAFLACAELGAIVISLNTKFKSHEMADIVSRSKCKTLIMWPGFKNLPFLDILSEIPSDGLAALQSIVFYREDETSSNQLPACLQGKETLSYDKLLQNAPITPQGITEDDGLVVFTTSGTTGKPKFVLHTHFSVTVHAIEVNDEFGYENRDCNLLQVNPLCGTFGLTQALAGFAGGGTVCCLPVFDAQIASRIMCEERITDINGSDDMYAMLLDASKDDVPFPDIQYAGFAAFNPALGSIVADADMRQVPLMGLWGMSEVQAFVTHQDRSANVEDRARAGGRLISPTAVIRITDPDTGEELPLGQQGELEIKTISQMKEYLDNPEATSKAHTEDGFIKTGDLAIMEDERSFIFLSRMGDVLRLGGFLTDPVEIETVLSEHPAIEQAQVVGATGGSSSLAIGFVVVKYTVDVANLKLHAKSHLAGFKVPSHIEILDAFPTTQSANGVKIQRAVLRDMAAKIVNEKRL
jgi:fatty-acyl-CoA synthase